MINFISRKQPIGIILILNPNPTSNNFAFQAQLESLEVLRQNYQRTSLISGQRNSVCVTPASDDDE